MFNGRISGILTGEDITKEKVLQYAFSGSAGQK
jgi:hypothetical protein